MHHLLASDYDIFVACKDADSCTDLYNEFFETPASIAYEIKIPAEDGEKCIMLCWEKNGTNNNGPAEFAAMCNFLKSQNYTPDGVEGKMHRYIQGNYKV